MTDDKILKVSLKLVELMNKQADHMLPHTIAKLVKTHSGLAVGSAWIPVPGLDVAAGAVNIWSMYGRINSNLGLSIKDNVLKTIASGVATNLASYVAMSGVGSLVKAIPIFGQVGGAIAMSASLYAITISSGWVYLKALCLLAEKDGQHLNMSKLADAMKQVLADSSIKDFVTQAKKEYR